MPIPTPETLINLFPRPINSIGLWYWRLFKYPACVATAVITVGTPFLSDVSKPVTNPKIEFWDGVREATKDAEEWKSTAASYLWHFVGVTNQEATPIKTTNFIGNVLFAKAMQFGWGVGGGAGHLFGHYIGYWDNQSSTPGSTASRNDSSPIAFRTASANVTATFLPNPATATYRQNVRSAQFRLEKA